MNRKFIFCFFALCSIALGSCGRGATSNHQSDLHRGLGGEPASLDPAAAADTFSQEVLEDLYEGLTAQDAYGNVVPGVASSWSVDQNGRHYKFLLRPDARWSNGAPVVAQDFVRAWRHVVDPKTSSAVADDLRMLNHASEIMSGKLTVERLGVDAPDDLTLSVTLERPAPYFPQLLTHPAAYPSYSRTESAHVSKGVTITNGPYTFVRWLPGSSITLQRNEFYWDRLTVKIARVEYQFIANENAQYASYRAGELDITDTVPANAVEGLIRRGSPEFVRAPFLATAYYAFNLSQPPFANNPKLRQALSMAIDRRKIVSALGFGETPAFGLVAPGINEYNSQTFRWSDLSSALRETEAKKLYKEAGYSDGSPLRIRLLYNANPAIKNTAVIAAQMWKDVLGVETVLSEEEYRVFLQSRKEKSRWDIIRLGWTADYNDAISFLDIFRNGSPNNDAGYSSKSFDELLDAAGAAADSDRRTILLEQSERLLLSDCPLIPIYFFVSKRMVKPYVQGLHISLLNRIPTKYLALSDDQHPDNSGGAK